MMQFTMSGTMLRFDETTLRFSFSRDGATWSGCDGIEPQLTREDRSFSFAGAATVTHERIETGTGVGVRSVFAGFAGADYAFETYIWIERSSGDVLCEWVPLRECGAEPRIDRVLWPAPLSFDHADAHDVTLITHEQGVMIPNNWPTEVGTDAVSFGGRFETAGGTCPGSRSCAATGMRTSPSARRHGTQDMTSTIRPADRTRTSECGSSQVSAAWITVVSCDIVSSTTPTIPPSARRTALTSTNAAGCARWRRRRRATRQCVTCSAVHGCMSASRRRFSRTRRSMIRAARQE